MNKQTNIQLGHLWNAKYICLGQFKKDNSHKSHKNGKFINCNEFFFSLQKESKRKPEVSFNTNCMKAHSGYSMKHWPESFFIDRFDFVLFAYIWKPAWLSAKIAAEKQFYVSISIIIFQLAEAELLILISWKQAKKTTNK